MRKPALNRPGTDRIAEVAKALDSRPGFWDGVHDALASIGFTADYVNEFSLKGDNARLKYIKDSVWGMMEFARDEMALVDSPLLQRLRGIKQTGLTYLTYPNAEHTRFSHTLGVAHVVKKLLRAVNEQAQRQPEFTAGGQTYRLFSTHNRARLQRSLVHAALLHDIGHFGFSHAGESAFSSHVDRLCIGPMPMQDLFALFREKEINTKKLSEIVAIIVCLSPRFREFHAKIDSDQDADAIFRMCCFISGTSHDPEYPGLTNVISGAVVDADKIDYINRDSLYCGIPAGIDVSRIFLNTSLVEINAEQAKKIQGKTRQSTRAAHLAPGVHFIVNSAGIDTYDEIATSKSILYHRVYLHPATRNAEQILSECVARLCDRGSKSVSAPLVNVWNYYPFRDQQLLDKLASDPLTKQLAKRLNERILPKRAFVLFRDVCEPFVKISDLFAEGRAGRAAGAGLVDKDTELLRASSWRIWSELFPLDPIEAPERLEEFRQKIREGAVELRESTDPTFSRSSLARSEPYVGLAARYLLEPAPEVLVREKNSIGRSVHWTKSEELTTAENVFKGMDYVFSDREWLPFIRVATVRQIFQFGQTLPPWKLDDFTEPTLDFDQAQFEVLPTIDLLLEDISSRIGIDYDEMVKSMIDAARVNFFGDSYRIVPLERAQEQACEEIALRYQHFSGERGWHVSHRSAMNFIRQFPIDLRNEAINLTLDGDILSAVDFARGIWSAVEALDSAGKKLIFCRFSPNSGNFIGMLFERDTFDDLKKRGHGFCRNLGELDRALEANTNRTVVFVDDQFASGSQARAQLYHWSNTKRESWPEDIRGEQNIDLTDPTSRISELLRKGEVVLAFLYGTEEGKKEIEKTARDLGFANVVVRSNETLPSKSANLSAQMRAFLEDVGIQVLKHCQRDPLASNALGYGGKASLIVTPYNAPSHMITAFWCPGLYKGLPWLPLFLRRGYRKHLVIG